MTNHDEAAGSSGIGDMGGSAHAGGEPTVHGARPTEYKGHGHAAGSCGETQVTLRTPAELADALPYLLGYRPEDSIVLAALHDRDKRGRFGGRARLGIPARSDDWPSVAQQLAHGLVTGSERRGTRPESMVAYLVQEPRSGETGRDVMERLRPLAQSLRTACGDLDVPVVEALCISGGRFWSYCCPSPGCCPAEGQPMGLPGTSVLAAAATYAGLQVRGTLKEFRARLSPMETAAALDQEVALDAASLALVPRILHGDSREGVAEETLGLAERVMARFAEAARAPSAQAADLRDDELLGHDEAAAMILGLQDRTTRDRAAEWMEGPEAAVALRLWRALARRCVGSYGEHAAAPLTLAGWVAWSTGDEVEAREALAMALGADPDYLFARLLHQACNEGLHPETVRRCLRAERAERDAEQPAEGDGDRSPAAATSDRGAAPPRRCEGVVAGGRIEGEAGVASPDSAEDVLGDRPGVVTGDECQPGERVTAVEEGDEPSRDDCDPAQAAPGPRTPQTTATSHSTDTPHCTGTAHHTATSQSTATPHPTIASRRRRKTRAASGGSRAILPRAASAGSRTNRHSPRTVDARHRRPTGTPTGGDGSRPGARDTTDRPAAHGGPGHRAEDGDT
ncbi:DUF4192 domain-containing protein [Streptomyces sp. NPDC005708]|uniref:DUF4192 domain-containing protein n=1 Tax=Streptomyces sp. NPDC005708 TaxID=3154564 RepID=UPI0033CD3D74